MCWCLCEGPPRRQGAKVVNLVFSEKLDLITWLEGASNESEFIKSLEGEQEALAAAQNAAGIASGAADGSDGRAGAVKGAKQVDQRLQEIYSGERKMGDRNTVLRGIKPTVRMSIA